MAKTPANRRALPIRPDQNIGRAAPDSLALDSSTFFEDFIREDDHVTHLSDVGDQLLINREGSYGRQQLFLHATIGSVGRPKERAQGSGYFVHADLPKCLTGPKILVLDGFALRQYFYSLSDDRDHQTLYDLLGGREESTLTELRLAWRVRNIELALAPDGRVALSHMERAFNLLADPEIRTCYDAMLRDNDAPPIFPYGAVGSIRVEGKISDDGKVFFASRILAFKPEVVTKRVSLLLRQCEFLVDRVICHDSRRKLEVCLDGGLLPGVQWDLTWNHWKHWLKGRIDVDATFVRVEKSYWEKGEWMPLTSLVAIPSRLQVTLSNDFRADIERAQSIHSVLGLHAEVVAHVRKLVEKEPVEHKQIQKWFDQLDVSPRLEPNQITWRPDYEQFYFEELRIRSLSWFLFRDEYLFVFPRVVVSEIPQSGHATYLFVNPTSLEQFMARYATTTRPDIRHNRADVATGLGFIGRVVRGTKKKRWLQDVLKLAGECPEPVAERD